MKRILSAIQPTGEIHFGNYFGAVQNWVLLQEKYHCIYGVVDYHAMTMPYQPAKLRENTWDMIFNLLSIGVKTENLFIQSLVPEHSELGWIFNCFCAYGELSRMTQFKDKSDQVKDGDKDAFISAGLFDYPVLQSADILIYKADFVPVGKDQEQHLELSRNIAARFNHTVGKEYFQMPEALFTEALKIRSLADPTRKMSKSLGEKHYISVFEEEKSLRKKVGSAVTDAGDEQTQGIMSPGVENLFVMLKAAGSTQLYHEMMEQYKNPELKLSYKDLKEAVADALFDLTRKFTENKKDILSRKKEIKNTIKDASASIRKIAQETLKEVKELCGLQNIKY